MATKQLRISLRFRDLLIIYLCSVLFVACSTKLENPQGFTDHSNNCIQPKFSSSYPAMPTNKEGYRISEQEAALPMPPWKPVLSIPIPEHEVVISSNIDLIREVSNRTEIWIYYLTGTVDEGNRLSWDNTKESFFMYYPDEDRLEEKGSIFDEIGRYHYPMYLGKQNTVWLIVTTPLETIPPFSRLAEHVIYQYDENTQRFSRLEFQQEIPKDTGSMGNIMEDIIVFDKQRNLFWFYVQDIVLDKISGKYKISNKFYSINPEELTVRESNATPPPYGGPMDDHTITVSLSGDIYLALYTQADEWTQSDFSIVKFIPEDDKFEDVSLRNSYSVPYVYLEPFFSIFSDSSGNLWLGMQAWQAPDGMWHKILPPPELITRVPMDTRGYHLDSPNVVLESSDGRLWLESNNGMISYDPISEEWCWFTIHKSNIVEDSIGNLWMMVNGTLYQYPASQNGH